MKFKVGDIVSHCHYDGEFEVVENDMKDFFGEEYPFKIDGLGEESFSYSLTADGKTLTHHDKPSITLIRRPKKLETREVELFGNVYDGCIYHYDSEEKCKDHESLGCLNPDNKKIKVTYMVEA